MNIRYQLFLLKLCFIFLFLSEPNLLGQSVSKDDLKVDTTIRRVSNDIINAEEIKDSIVGPVNISKGFGSQMDFYYNDNYKETNCAWFKFTISKDTVLTFDIVPVKKNTYSFALFKCPDKNCIDYIRARREMPDRACFSGGFEQIDSRGLSQYYTETWIGEGFGLSYVSSMPVKAGETFYLMVSYPVFQISRGFSIYFYNYWPNKPQKLMLKRAPVNKPVVIENLLFENNSAVLLKQSYVSLDKLVKQLQDNKTMTIEIHGHTDNVGDEAKNQKLSEQRAKAVADYLVSKKIAKERLSYRGFGSKQGIASNDTEEGRKKNRRVEFVILTR